MKFENLVLQLIQRLSAHLAEIGDVLLVLAAPGQPAVTARNVLQRGLAHVLLLCRTVPEPRVAGAEDRPENTVAGMYDVALTLAPQSQAVTLGAGLLRQRDRV